MKADSPEALMLDVILNEMRYTPRPNEHVLDIGAHHGYFSLYCAMRGAYVHAYEPDPDNYSKLKMNVLLAENSGGGLIRAMNLAVWSDDGERLLWHDAQNSGAHSLVFPCSDYSITVKTVSLTRALNAIYWDCVKVDVEGAEAQIFLSAKSADFRLIKYLTMELHNHVLTREQHRALLQRLHQEFPKVEEVPEEKEGLPTGRVAKVLCWGAV